MNQSALYENATRCEANYHAAVIAEYGESKASEARYMMHHKSPVVRQARFEMREANTAWIASVRGENAHV